LGFGIGAGLLGWIVGETAHEFFKPTLYRVEVMGLTADRPTQESQDAADSKNATLAFAILGCVTGLGMGLAGGLADRSLARGVTVGLGAQAAGALVGVLSSFVFLPSFYGRAVPDQDNLLTPTLIHGGIWAAIGAVGGLAFAIGMRSRGHLLNALGGACVGAFSASVLYHVLSGTLVLDSSTTAALGSSAKVRLMAMILVTVLVAIGSARGALGRVPPSPPASG